MPPIEPKPGIPLLSVVLVTYNSAHVVSTALSPLEDVDDVEIIVVDNASSDGTRDVLRARHPGVHVVESPRNGGFAAGVNQGTTRATAPVVLLLNPDARVEWPDLQRCLELFEDPMVGAVAPRTVQPDGRQAILDAGRAPTIWRCFTHATGLSRLGARFLEGLYLFPWQAEGVRAVDWVSGACMLLRRSAFEELGGLSERWFMYAEDVDVCLRAGDAGYRVLLRGDAVVVHEGGASSRTDSGPERANAAWLLNTYDLYCLRYRPGRVRALGWRSVATMWMLTRAGVYRRRSTRDPKGQLDWQTESRKFVTFARAIWQAPRPGGQQR
jgi:N-acetylglucosaminyl-diphospho-decaprenol L-rhamnosyltransferase